MDVVRVVSCQSRPGFSVCAGGADGGRSRTTLGSESVVSGRAFLGPGTLRVGRFIGRLGVVSLRAVEVGLDLDQRVVRRHVAKLEATGWLEGPWVWGEGSVVWLTSAGVEGSGLGGMRALKLPPAPTTIAHGVLVGWSAARAERRGRTWKSARELALDRERWAVRMRFERGYSTADDYGCWPSWTGRHYGQAPTFLRLDAHLCPPPASPSPPASGGCPRRARARR